MKDMHKRLMSGSSLQQTGSQASNQLIVVSQGNVQVSKSTVRQPNGSSGIAINLVSSPSVGTMNERDSGVFKAINME